MVGNVWQWCADEPTEVFYENVDLKRTPARKRLYPGEGVDDKRGCSWEAVSPGDLRVAYRITYYTDPRESDYGFRCLVALPGP